MWTHSSNHHTDQETVLAAPQQTSSYLFSATQLAFEPAVAHHTFPREPTATSLTSSKSLLKSHLTVAYILNCFI